MSDLSARLRAIGREPGKSVLKYQRAYIHEVDPYDSRGFVDVDYADAALDEVMTALEAELAAERGNRCGTCGHRVWLGWRWTCPHLQAVVSASTEDAVEVPDDFGCTEYEPAEQGGKS